MRKRFALFIPAVALAAGLAACGDSAPSKADFTAKADGACTPGNTTISTTAKPASAGQVATAAGTATTTVDSQVASLRTLKSPGGDDKAQVQGIIAAIAEVSGPTKALQDAATKNDEAAMATAAKDMQAKADAAHNSAQAYGLAQCGIQLKFGLGNLFDGVRNVVKTSYAGKAEGLCRESIQKSDAIPEPGRNSSLASAARYLDTQLTLSRKLATDFQALATPPGDEHAVADILAALETLNAKGQAVLDAAKANNGQLVLGRIEDVNVAGNALNAKFDAYGLKVCGTVSG